MADGRFIPTHVGNTSGARSAPCRRPVHPHACGEHWYFQFTHRRSRGSSPRMWGTRAEERCSLQRLRFIPTHVGNTSSPATSAGTVTVHPHACGEHAAGNDRCESAVGSSPRMWGTRRGTGSGRVLLRFIPTHVGNTPSGRIRTPGITVHPHACGEHVALCCGPASSLGSSPRMWGTQQGWRKRERGQRFIPTHVGNTAISLCWSIVSAVHPHACGEHCVR